MKVWQYRKRSTALIVVALLCLLIFGIYSQVFQRNDSDGSAASTIEYCDQSTIRQYFMNGRKYLIEN